MRKKSLLVLMIVLLAFTGVLAACGNNNDNGNTTNNTSNNTPDNTNNQKDDTGNDKSNNKPEPEPENKEPVNITIMHQDGGNAYAQNVKEDDVYFQKFSELLTEYYDREYNIKFDFNPSASYGDELSIMMASGDLPDVMWTRGITDAAHPSAVEDGAFLDLTDLIKEHGPNLLEKIPQYIWDHPLVSQDGRIYGIPKLAPAENIKVMLYRKDWLDKLNMDPPMTLDEYLAFFEAVKTTDLNGNGQQDEIGFGARKGLSYSEAFFGYYGVYPGRWQMVDGQFIPDIINPKMKDAVAFYEKLYENGYMNEDFIMAKAADVTQKLKAGQVAMYLHQTLNLVNGMDPETFAEDGVEFRALPGPVNEDGKANLVPQARGFGPVWAVSSNTENAVEIIKMFDWLYSDDIDKQKFFSFGIEGTTYEEKDGEIVWDPNSEANKNGVRPFYQVMINMAKDVRLQPVNVERSDYKEALEEAMAYAEENVFEDPSLYMPTLEAMKGNPELGHVDGSLFMDMVAAVVMGKEELDPAFDAFVEAWKSQGGDEAIAEATEWYNSYHN